MAMACRWRIANQFSSDSGGDPHALPEARAWDYRSSKKL
jgi:hypothetical protein